MNRNLSPYDKGEVLQARPWPERYSIPGGSVEDRNDFGKVDFDNEEGATEFIVQIVKNDPLPSSGERYTVRITNFSGDEYIIEEVDD